MSNITKYIDQLVEEIQQNKKITNGCYTDSLFQDDSSVLFSSQKVKTLAEIVGVKKDQLPPIKQLTYNQSVRLVATILELLASYKIFADFPNLLPADKKYQLLHKSWNMSITLQGKEHHIDFCHYTLEDCPYQGFCTICDELNDEE